MLSPSFTFRFLLSLPFVSFGFWSAIFTTFCSILERGLTQAFPSPCLVHSTDNSRNKSYILHIHRPRPLIVRKASHGVEPSDRVASTVKFARSTERDPFKDTSLHIRVFSTKRDVPLESSNHRPPLSRFPWALVRPAVASLGDGPGVRRINRVGRFFALINGRKWRRFIFPSP